MALTHTINQIYLPFLWPLALPKASTLQRFLSTTTSSSSTSSTSSSTSSSPSQSTASDPDSVPNPIPSSPAATKKPVSLSLPYCVNRTPTANLPIYLLAKRGGNLKQTRLRKIEGDINTLRVHLRDALKL